MSRLATCPRCGAFVQPGWAACKICGFGPEGAPDLRDPTPPRRREGGRAAEVLGGLLTLAVLALLAWGAVVGVRAIWTGREGFQAHQEYVVVPRE